MKPPEIPNLLFYNFEFPRILNAAHIVTTDFYCIPLPTQDRPPAFLIVL